MNARERTLLFVLVGIVGSGIFFYGVKFWWYDQFMEYNATIERMTKETMDTDEKLTLFRTERKKLVLARLKSLPANPEQAAAEYMAYLQPVLNKSGLTVDELSHGAAVKLKPVAPVANIKEVGHQSMTFTVRAHGELAQLAKALEQIQKTPYEHRIRSLTVDRAETSAKKDASSKLNILMVIETLLIAKTDNKPGFPPGFNPLALGADLVVAERLGAAPINFGMVAAAVQLRQTLPQTAPDRDYADIARKNIFIGAVPPPPVKPPTVKPPKEKLPPPEPENTDPKEPDEYIPGFVYLTHTDPGRQEAYLRNRRFKVPETKLIAKAQSGYDTFRVTDENGDYVYFRAKVLKVELRQIMFQIKDQVYSLQVGQSLADMKELSFNLTRVELEDLGLYDREFAAKELEKDKKTKKDNKGRPTKGSPVKGK